MNRFYIITNKEKDEYFDNTKKLQQYIREKGGVCLTQEDGDLSDDTECIIVLGGDGTLLHTALDYVEKEIPILGINLGTLGFLTALEKDEMFEGIDLLMAGEYRIEKRMMLCGKVFRDGHLVSRGLALNDIIVSRSGFARVVETNLYINDVMVDGYSGDGVIISTPTGSTGYNLSAGGPVALPDTELMLITPICPHTLSARSMVVSADDSIRVEIGRRSKTEPEEAFATYDGQMVVDMESGDYVEVCRARECIRLVKIVPKTFYEILRAKI